MKEKIKISVIIPMRNAKHTILDCLKALDGQIEPPYEVILVDNGSTDGGHEMVKRKSKIFKNLNLIIISQNIQGPAAARNKGISLATGEIIAFTDSDCIPDKNWIKNINRNFQKNCNLDIIGGTEWGINPTTSISGKLLSISWLPPKIIQQKSIIKRKEDLFLGKSISTFNCAFKREILLEIDGFDENFFPAGEDIDVWMRALEHNATILVWVSNMVVNHNQDISLIALMKKMFAYGKGLSQLIKKHFSNKIIIKGLLGIDYERSHSSLTAVIFLTPNMAKAFLFFCAIILLCFFSIKLAAIILVSLFIFSSFKMKRSLKLRGYEVSFPEGCVILIYFIFKKISEEIGRIYGSVKFGVVCI